MHSPSIQALNRPLLSALAADPSLKRKREFVRVLFKNDAMSV
jgi:hypothetical protein